MSALQRQEPDPRAKAIEAMARKLCEQGIRALNGSEATWERHADGFRGMAREALAAALAALEEEGLVLTDTREVKITWDVVERAWAAGMKGCRYIEEWGYDNLARAIEASGYPAEVERLREEIDRLRDFILGVDVELTAAAYEQFKTIDSYTRRLSSSVPVEEEESDG